MQNGILQTIVRTDNAKKYADTSFHPIFSDTTENVSLPGTSAGGAAGHNQVAQQLLSSLPSGLEGSLPHMVPLSLWP